MSRRVTRPRAVEKDHWPSWRYSPDGEGQIFQCQDDVPVGWTKRVSQQLISVEPLSLDHDELVQQLSVRGIAVHPTWGKAHMKKVLDDHRTSR